MAAGAQAAAPAPARSSRSRAISPTRSTCSTRSAARAASSTPGCAERRAPLRLRRCDAHGARTSHAALRDVIVEHGGTIAKTRAGYFADLAQRAALRAGRVLTGRHRAAVARRAHQDREPPPARHAGRKPGRSRHRCDRRRRHAADQVPRQLSAGRPRRARGAPPAEARAGLQLHDPHAPAGRRGHAAAVARARRDRDDATPTARCA